MLICLPIAYARFCATMTVELFQQRPYGTENLKSLYLALYRNVLNPCPGPLGLPANVYSVKSKSPNPDGLLSYPDRHIYYNNLTTPFSPFPLYITLQNRSLVGHEAETTSVNQYSVLLLFLGMQLS